jgi:PspA-Associated protein
LQALRDAVRRQGAPVPLESLVASELVLPAEDTSLDQVRALLAGEGLIPGKRPAFGASFLTSAADQIESSLFLVSRGREEGGGFAAAVFAGVPRRLRGRPSGLKGAAHRAGARRPAAGRDPGA